MNVLSARVVVRERPLFDVVDLALRFVVVHGGAYARLAAAVLVLPALLACATARLFGWVAGGCVALALASVATVPFTLLAARLVFEDPPRVKDVLAASARALPGALAVRLLGSLALAAGTAFFLVPGGWVLAAFLFTDEVLLLERASATAALGRASRIAGASLGAAMLAAILLVALQIAAVVGADAAGRTVLSELVQLRPPPSLFSAGGSELGIVGLFAAAPLLATIRFFVYLDVRTRAEGWDVQTRFAALASRAAAGAALAIALVFGASTARAEEAHEPAPELAEGTRALEAARAGATYAFCTKPRRPMLPRHAELCPLADEVEGCAGFATACDERKAPEPPPSWLRLLARVLAPLGKALVWIVVALAVVLVAVPIVLALRRAREKRQAPRALPATSTAVLAPPPAREEEAAADPEGTLARAGELARAGDGTGALALYLAASLAALARAGALRIARHRTNGDYVRACADPAAREPLREVVREVDLATFGERAPDAETVSRVAERATALVASARKAAVVATMALAVLLAGCGGGAGALDDPSGTELPVDVLGRAGFRVERLGRSLASLPIPDAEAHAPMREVVVVDVERVQLEDESRAHLLRWVESGGTVLLFGSPSLWPAELGAVATEGGDREVVVVSASGDGVVSGVRLAGARGLAWTGARVLARSGGVTWAALAPRGRGDVVGAAGRELFTNVGVSRAANAAALVALASHAALAAAREGAGEDDEAPETAVLRARSAVKLLVAQPEDGVPPPSNPFASLVRAGLGTGTLHALLAAVVLFLAYGVRQARAAPAPAEARRAFTEHVEATGAYYARARAHAHALEAYGRFVLERLRARAPRGTSPAAFLAHRAELPLAEAEALLERAAPSEGTARRDDPDALAALGELRAAFARAKL